MAQTAKDRLIEAWIEFIKENKIDICCNDACVGWEAKSGIDSLNTARVRVYFGVDVCGISDKYCLTHLFYDMLNSLHN